MNYPKVSFERKLLVTLKTFSNRNGLPDRAALGADRKPPICVGMAGCDPCSIVAERRAYSGFAAGHENGNSWYDPHGPRYDSK
jgi:hypothetical protein